MKRLLVLRHAKAEKDQPRRADFERRLSPRGEGNAEDLGRRLALRRVEPDAIVTSPARRALETARLVARELDFPWKAIRLEERLYLADLDTLLEIVRACEDDARTLLLVGHNPGVSELAQALARNFSETLPTCAAAALDCAADTWAGVRPASAVLRWYDVPQARA